MKKIDRLFVNICSNNVSDSKSFYTKLFDFDVQFDSDWFVHLVSKGEKLELGIIDRNSDLVPEQYRDNPQGFYLTFVVVDVDAIFEAASQENLEILAKPENTFYGQRRMLLKDPSGALVDISSPTVHLDE
ncbi:VOC family protein [Flagellimonas meridianipacifica]|uniref:Glyoxalase-like protein n=1 Tax=Flagellimonas meridianipacifica TaxID=1080225 RepID=A0A2T0MBK1_9FLAO|nr:VOC family protein [Allomuricauda pacifica]PRX54877.1 glyoxalase-like protein [Allomuricauda pacifica]